MKQTKQLIAIIAVAVASVSAAASAAPAAAAAPPASVYFEAPATAVRPGDTVTVRVLLDTADPVNAYAMMVRVPADHFTVLAVNTAHSVVTIWQDEPAVSADGDIFLKGGSVAPFSGKGGELLELTLQATGEGTTTLALDQASVYCADGKGTEIVPQHSDLAIAVTASAPPVASSSASSGTAAAAATPPHITTLSFVPDPTDTGSKLVSLAAADSASGIQAISIRYRTGILWSVWERAVNPTVVPAGTWTVELRTTNNAGLAATETLYDWSVFFADFWWIAALALVLLAAGAVLLRARSLRRRVVE